MTTTVQRLSELNFASLSPAGGLFPSPITWEDQTFYFLMLDRFSDGRENGYKDNEGNLVRSGTTPPYSPAGAENAVKTEADAARAGRDAQGVREQNRLSETIGGDVALD